MSAARVVAAVFTASLLLLHPLASSPGAAQVPEGRAAVTSLSFPELDFDPPDPEVLEVAGVPVLFLHDGTLPLVSVYASFRGGYGRFGRENYAAATALPALMRYGGTTELPPDSVDQRLERYAIQTSFGTGGESVVASVNVLSRHLPTALELWGRLLTHPRFDPDQVEIWRGRALEQVRRRGDSPQTLAFSEFNRLMYGDHPIGWEMEASDLEPEDLAPDRLRDLHKRIVCREQLVLGAVGDVPWPELEARLRAIVLSVPRCTEPLPPPPQPSIRDEGGLFVISRELEQSVLVMAQPTDVRMEESPDYFAAQIGNAILGGGGFSSRLLGRVRTEEGYAYSASSLWTMPRRHRGILGAVTRTRPENAVPAIRLILNTMAELAAAEPGPDEVRTAIDRVVNGFVFNFETPAQIVSRRMFYLAQDLPADWLERYMAGIQDVTPDAVHRVFAQHLRPRSMTVLVVGDPRRMALDGLEDLLGPAQVWEVRRR